MGILYKDLLAFFFVFFFNCFSHKELLAIFPFISFFKSTFMLKGQLDSISTFLRLSNVVH